MDFDVVTSAVSAAGGAVVWELLKQAAGAWFKRRGEASAAARKAVGEQCTAVNKALSECVGKAVEYLTGDCTEARRKELARLIVHETKQIAASITQLNHWATKFKVQPVSSACVIGFRRAVTLQLDRKGYVAQHHEASDVKRVYEAALFFQEALTRIHVATNYAS